MATTWKELRNELNISNESENIINLEKEIIRTMVNIREEKGLTQAELADICDVKQPVIARMESSVHSPQINSLLKILMHLGYTLEIVPINSNQKM
jgi:predicted transcriptional regulator